MNSIKCNFFCLQPSLIKKTNLIFILVIFLITNIKHISEQLESDNKNTINSEKLDQLIKIIQERHKLFILKYEFLFQDIMTDFNNIVLCNIGNANKYNKL